MASPPATIAFLHTSSIHIATFARLMAARLPACHLTHLVDESLLADARRDGLDAGISGRVGHRLDELAEDLPALIVCTCSTIGPLVERGDRPTPTLRIDRPMAEAAVAIAHASGGRIGVAAALASTVEPTLGLLADAADAAGIARPDVDVIPCFAAWPSFERGDQDAYGRAMAEAIQSVADRYAAIVLAQASMAVARPFLGELTIPVLDSPSQLVDEIARHLGES